ncbi:tRNA-dihydrouridine(47) synthase-like [Caerostris extrusa]|uniref:tRNA-dihydrouridine(47) synthase [NAD(P)(+)] n=1 Tax=Caerostris extrusa TaxID=172846 RepID=A0AAV4SC82_CAEEX|nr:tRNA-dihydrouridine(47) synthase-like [Caerostris extrusa]
MEELAVKSAGVACIKSEFLLQDHVREINLKFVAANDKKRVVDENATEYNGPSKKKLKGQNKHRPRNQRTPKSEKLCFKIGVEESCPFGDSCCYSHDIESYLAKKPPDLGPTCYLYSTYGKCPYSFSCRFAIDHIKNGKNNIQEDLWTIYKDKKLFVNTLTKDLQFSLRKHNYNFKKSDNAFKNFSATVQFNKGKKQTSACTNNESLNSFSIPVEEQKNTQIVIPHSDEKIHETERTNQKFSDDDCQVSKDYTNSENLAQENTVAQSDKIELNTADVTNILPDKSSKAELTISESNKNIDDILFEPEIKKVDFKNKLYLAPLTTVGNLPFRRICKEFGADITCSEMCVALSLLQGQPSEWALLKRHYTEDIFGIQLCGSHPDVMTRCCQVLSENVSFDFVDINMGCPLEGIYKRVLVVV